MVVNAVAVASAATLNVLLRVPVMAPTPTATTALTPFPVVTTTITPAPSTITADMTVLQRMMVVAAGNRGREPLRLWMPVPVPVTLLIPISIP
jgi:hypothetical protein